MLFNGYLSAQVRERSEYISYFGTNNNPEVIASARNILVLHFDFCSVDSYCKDTTTIIKFINRLAPSDIIVIDTLYNSEIPSFLKAMKIIFVNRTEMQRKGLYSEKPILIKKNKKKVKLL